MRNFVEKLSNLLIYTIYNIYILISDYVYRRYFCCQVENFPKYIILKENILNINFVQVSIKEFRGENQGKICDNIAKYWRRRTTV